MFALFSVLGQGDTRIRNDVTEQRLWNLGDRKNAVYLSGSNCTLRHPIKLGVIRFLDKDQTSLGLYLLQSKRAVRTGSRSKSHQWHCRRAFLQALGKNASVAVELAQFAAGTESPAREGDGQIESIGLPAARGRETRGR